jgi:cytosine/adenosine deaminase-related metal-dependent hydrolase
MKTLPRIASERALHVVTYNFTRVMNLADCGALQSSKDVCLVVQFRRQAETPRRRVVYRSGVIDPRRTFRLVQWRIDAARPERLSAYSASASL